MGPLISEEQRNKVDGLVKLAQEEGAEVVVGGEKVLEKKGYFFTPTLLSNVTKDMNIAKEEVFGPVLCLQAAESFDEAIDIANDTKYGLSAVIYSDRLDVVGKFIDDIESGMVHVNQGTAPESHMPFGGVKESGIGQGSVGETTKDFYTDVKTVYIKYY